MRVFPPSVPSASADSLAHRASANAAGCQVAKDNVVGFSRFEPPSRLGEADVDHAAT